MSIGSTPPVSNRKVPGYVQRLTYLESLEAPSDQRGRHLARTEVEIFPPLGVDHPNAARGGNNWFRLEAGHICRLRGRDHPLVGDVAYPDSIHSTILTESPGRSAGKI